MSTLRSSMVVGILALASSPAPASNGQCAAPTQLPAVRTGGGLTVESPPRTPPAPGGKRLRADVIGPLSTVTRASDRRFWAGIEVPSFVPITLGTLELFTLEQKGDRYVALYRDPYGASSCTLGGSANCSFEARIFACDGTVIAALPLNAYFSRDAGLELQDIQYADGTLYFNEACQSYSKENQGKCSALVAVDTGTGKLLWRTKHLVSNNVFLVAGDYLVTGYGFTAEPSSLFIVRRSDGSVVTKQPLKKVAYPGGNHDAMKLGAGDVLQVGLYEHDQDVYVELVGLKGAQPRFGRIKEPPAIP